MWELHGFHAAPLKRIQGIESASFIMDRGKAEGGREVSPACVAAKGRTEAAVIGRYVVMLTILRHLGGWMRTETP